MLYNNHNSLTVFKMKSCEKSKLQTAMKLRIGLVISYLLYSALGTYMLYTRVTIRTKILSLTEITYQLLLIMSLYTKNTPFKKALIVFVLLIAASSAIMITLIDGIKISFSQNVIIFLLVGIVCRSVVFYGHYRYVHFERELDHIFKQDDPSMHLLERDTLKEEVN